MSRSKEEEVVVARSWESEGERERRKEGRKEGRCEKGRISEEKTLGMARRPLISECEVREGWQQSFDATIHEFR